MIGKDQPIGRIPGLTDPLLDTALTTFELVNRTRVRDLAEELDERAPLIAGDAEGRLRSRLLQFREGDIDPARGERPVDLFARLCEQAKIAFPGDPSNAEILANSATPDLTRFILDVLRTYQSKCEANGANLDEGPAARALASAFGLTQARRGPPNKVAALRKPMVVAACKAMSQARALGIDDSKKLMDVAVADAFDVYTKGVDTTNGGNDAHVSNVKSRIRAMLEAEREAGNL